MSSPSNLQTLILRAAGEMMQFQLSMRRYDAVPAFNEEIHPKINMEHNNGGLEDDFPLLMGDV